MKKVVHILKKKNQLSILYIYLIETSVSEQESNSDVKDNGIVAYCIFFKFEFCDLHTKNRIYETR